MKTFVIFTNFEVWKVIRDGLYVFKKIVEGVVTPKRECEFNAADWKCLN